MGGLFGYYGNALLKNCYYDGGVIAAFTPEAGFNKPGYAIGINITPSGGVAYGSNLETAKALTTEKMTGTGAIGADTIDFSYTAPDTVQANWIVKANAANSGNPSNYYRYYPQLKALADLGGDLAALSLSSVTLDTARNAPPPAPAAPTVSGPAETSIALEAIAGAEYSKDSGAIWQASPVFTGLAPNAQYTFISRIKETPEAPASPVSAPSAAIKTLAGKGNGLPGGAIAGIVIGSVIAAGLAGFAIYWFAVKKKKFSDLFPKKS